MRFVSVVFIQICGVDVSTDEGARTAQELLHSIQIATYAHEGSLNKFLVDDKGILCLLVFGLPPLVHTDDSIRAVLTCFDCVDVISGLGPGLFGRFGVTQGTIYCGLVGAASRQEYTVLGDAVNLSARLMQNAPQNGILANQSVYESCKSEITFKQLNPIRVKGKAE